MIKIPHLKQFEDFYRKRLLEQIEQDKLDNPTFRESFKLRLREANQDNKKKGNKNG